MVRRSPEPVDVSLRYPAEGKYLRAAPYCVAHDLPDLVNVVPIQLSRLAQHAKSVGDIASCTASLTSRGPFDEGFGPRTPPPANAADPVILKRTTSGSALICTGCRALRRGISARELRGLESMIKYASYAIVRPAGRTNDH
jgi:hypothetical protein